MSGNILKDNLGEIIIPNNLRSLYFDEVNKKSNGFPLIKYEPGCQLKYISITDNSIKTLGSLKNLCRCVVIDASQNNITDVEVDQNNHMLNKSVVIKLMDNPIKPFIHNRLKLIFSDDDDDYSPV